MNLEQIKEMVAAVCASRTVTELAVRTGTNRLVVRRALAIGPQPLQTHEEKTAERPDELQTVRSPLVGIFHSRSSESQLPITVGSQVREKQILGAIESMRMLYEVQAGVGGIVAEVLVEDGQPVEYGQELFRIRPGSESAAEED